MVMMLDLTTSDFGSSEMRCEAWTVYVPGLLMSNPSLR